MDRAYERVGSVGKQFMLKQCLKIKGRGYCRQVFLVNHYDFVALHSMWIVLFLVKWLYAICGRMWCIVVLLWSVWWFFGSITGQIIEHNGN